MTLYHNSPKTGKAARCRARIACLYGTTHGTTIRRDGTVEVGTGGSTWSSLPNPPSEHNSEERIVIDPRDGKVKNIWSVDNRDLRNTRPTNTTVEEVAKKASDEQDNINDIDFEAEIGEQRYVGGQKASTKGSTSLKNDDEKVEGEAGRDENDIENIDFGAEVYDGNRMSTGDETTETSTNTTVEEETSELKPVKPLNSGTHDINIENDDTYTVSVYDGKNRLDIEMVDGYPTEDTVKNIQKYMSGDSDSEGFRMSIWTVDPESFSGATDSVVEEAIEEHHSADLFYLMDEKSAKDTAIQIEQRANDEVNSNAQRNLSAKEATDFVESWKNTEKAGVFPDDFSITTKPTHFFTADHIMKIWKKNHY